MAMFVINPDRFNAKFSGFDTSDWANNAEWPCSVLSGHYGWVAFDRNGLVASSLPPECPGDELSAFVADLMRNELPKNHPCYHVAVGQFEKGDK